MARGAEEKVNGLQKFSMDREWVTAYASKNSFIENSRRLCAIPSKYSVPSELSSNK